MEDLDVPVYDQVIHITYKKDETTDNAGEGGKEKKKEKFIDSFYTKKFIKLYFSKTK